MPTPRNLITGEMNADSKPTTFATVSTSAAIPTTPTGIVLTLENSVAFLSVLVSITLLTGVATKLISNQNSISLSIDQIKQALREYAANSQKLRDVERTLDLHVKDYTNQNVVLQMLLEQLNKKVEERVRLLSLEVREIQGYLQRNSNFSMRNRDEDREE